VASVEQGSPAAAAGLEPSDVIVGFAGDPVAGMDALHRRLTADRIGLPVPIVVLRNGQRKTLTIVPRESGHGQG
jgi:S1-C subfamily serine protease